MSIICLICKEKLLNSAPGSSLGSLNSLVENRDFLEKAKLLEKMKNLEIYCHQLEVHLNQLKNENDLLYNKVLTPTKNQLGNDDFAAIVKNDKVIWLKKDSPPLSGVVLSIFKKDTNLWVKLKLDKKIRTNNRPGLFGSFRFDKNKEITVPFEEIVLEKDYRKNSVIDENSISSASTPKSPAFKFFPERMPSFRNSTLSLPGEYLNNQNNGYNDRRKLQNGLYPIGSYDFINNFGSVNSVQFPYDANHNNSGEFQIASSSHPTIVHENITEESNGYNNQNLSEDEQRDYIILPQNQISNGHTNLDEHGTASSSPNPTSQDSKKHVTFADDLTRKPSNSKDKSDKSKGNHFRDHAYKNVSDMPMSIQEKVNFMTGDSSSTKYLKVSKVDVDKEISTVDIPSNHSIALQHTGDTSKNVDTRPTVSLEKSDLRDDRGINQSCFDITLATLFLECQVFDDVLLNRTVQNDHIQSLVQNIIKEEFVRPIRISRKYQAGYSNRLYEAISHLCSSRLDLEELMTIMFEYVFKIPPFISYSFEMCDYIHQFFIDFTDKAKTPSVQQLLERSLILQDNLKLRGEPFPALFLQMPNSEDGIIHYDAVIPSLTLILEHILERDTLKTETLSCYCNKTATLECGTCAKIHGKSPVLFCEDCSILLEAIHDQMYHKLELVPIKALKIPSTIFELRAIICLKENSYSTFLRNLDEMEPKWTYIEDFNNGIPKIVNIPKLEKWIESVCNNPSNLELNYVNSFQRKLLTECRMFLYLPVKNSFA